MTSINVLIPGLIVGNDHDEKEPKTWANTSFIKFYHTETQISQGKINEFSNQSKAENYINTYNGPNISAIG